MYMTMLLFVLSVAQMSYVQSHGILADPPARNTIWREGFPNPKNVDDNGLNCGGFDVMWGQNGGRCGVCGDPYQGPLRHEAGYAGGFANGIIGRTYKKGQVIPVEIKISANHKGVFQFHLCPNDDPINRVTQDCLDRYVLSDVNGETKFELLSSVGSASLRYSLKLPQEVTCSDCVLQWWWTAGNNAGPPDTKQETFVNCADIAITDGSLAPSPLKPQTSPQTSSSPELPSTVPPVNDLPPQKPYQIPRQDNPEDNERYPPSDTQEEYTIPRYRRRSNSRRKMYR